MSNKYLLRIAIVPVLVLTSTVTRSESGFGVTAGVGQSDNIHRSETNEQNETITSAGLDFSILQDTRRLSVNAAADLAYMDYQTNIYDDVVGNLNGLVKMKLVPERFEWLLQDNFGQVLGDPFAPSTPDNRLNINYFTTGPDFTLGLGGANKATLSGRYSKVNYEKTSSIASSAYVNNDRYSAALGFFHELSAASQVSLNVQSEKIDFVSNSAAVDYDQQQAFLRYDLKGSRTQLVADAGYTALNKQNADDTGYLVHVSIERKTTPSSIASLHLGHDFSDAGSSFRLQQGLQATGLEAQSTAQTSNPFVSEYVTLDWQLTRPRTSFGVGVSYFGESYERLPLFDQTRVTGNLRVSRALSPNISLLLNGNYSKAEPKQQTTTSSSYRDLDSSLGLSWQFSRHLSCSLEYNHYDRSSSSLTGSYQENRGWLKVRYAVERR